MILNNKEINEMKYIYFEEIDKLIPCYNVVINIDKTKHNIFKKPKFKLIFNINGFVYSFTTKDEKAVINAFKDFKKLWYEATADTIIVIKSNVSCIRIFKDIIDKKYIGEIGQVYKIFKSEEI